MPPDRAAFEVLATPVAWLDGALRILGANGAFGRWLGVGRRRLAGLPLDALEADGTALHGLVASRPPADGPLQLRRVPVRFPGQDRPRFADLTLSPMEAGAGAGDDVCWLLEAHPVAEFPGEDPALALPGALAASLRGLAHELRNPLAGLKGAAQLLARRAAARPGADDERALVDLVHTEVDRLAALLDQLLSPTPPRPHAPVNIHAVLERVLRLAENDAGWAVRLVRDYDPSLPPLDGDEDRLVQAAWNLVRNAIEAGAATVTLRTRAEHGVRIGDDAHALALRMEVVDDGRGVPEELAERVFLPLVSGRAEGSGLGLALAQQVAREHRGSLAYRSRPGHTVFTVLLPMPLPAPETAP